MTQRWVYAPQSRPAAALSLSARPRECACPAAGPSGPKRGPHPQRGSQWGRAAAPGHARPPPAAAAAWDAAPPRRRRWRLPLWLRLWTPGHHQGARESSERATRRPATREAAHHPGLGASWSQAAAVSRHAAGRTSAQRLRYRAEGGAAGSGRRGDEARSDALHAPRMRQRAVIRGWAPRLESAQVNSTSSAPCTAAVENTSS